VWREKTALYTAKGLIEAPQVARSDETTLMGNDWIKNPTNQVSRAPGGFLAFWRGELVYDADGAPRLFPTESAAWAYLSEREAR
jgi:hypothetical protein